ncbi:MAG TPA: hypothetical protein VGC78_06780 [Gaiellaceae bacterium]
MRWTGALMLAGAGASVALWAGASTGPADAAGPAASTTTASTTTTTTTVAPPKNTQPPTLTGTPTVGSTLTATNGSWSGSGVTYTYRFLRCDKTGGSCFAGGTTTQKTYTVAPSDVGNTIRVRVIAANGGGSSTATSAPTAVIKSAAPPPVSNGCPGGTGALAVTKLSPPGRLTIDRQDVSPVVVGRTTQQLQVRFHVSACNGRDVQGALVYVTAVPYQQFSIPPETATGADGWATLSLTRLRGFPAAAHQQLLVMFVRAREPGSAVLGGVSTRRLVSFRVDLTR